MFYCTVQLQPGPGGPGGPAEVHETSTHPGVAVSRPRHVWLTYSCGGKRPKPCVTGVKTLEILLLLLLLLRLTIYTVEQTLPLCQQVVLNTCRRVDPHSCPPLHTHTVNSKQQEPKARPCRTKRKHFFFPPFFVRWKRPKTAFTQ